MPTNIRSPVYYRDPHTGKDHVFLTNLPGLPALAMAHLYRQPWQSETFPRWIKQNLKIQAFYGTSENAVLIHIWTARSPTCSSWGCR